MAALRRPTDALAQWIAEDPTAAEGDVVLFGGTVPLLTGTFVHGRAWTVQLRLPDGSRLSHGYTVVED